MDGRMDGWMNDGRMEIDDGWMDAWVDGLVNGWVSRQSRDTALL